MREAEPTVVEHSSQTFGFLPGLRRQEEDMQECWMRCETMHKEVEYNQDR